MLIFVKNFKVQTKVDIAFYVVVAGFFLVSLLTLTKSFIDGEQGIYHSYVKSICEDGDLNIANEMANVKLHQKENSDRVRDFYLTKTLNYPDFHSYGGVVYWAPFYFAGKLLDQTSFLTSPGTEQINGVQVMLAFSIFILGCIILYLLYIESIRITSSRTQSIIVIGSVAFGTPFMLHWLWAVEYATLFAPLFVSLIYIFMRTREFINVRDSFYLGMLIGIAHLFKFESVFYIIGVSLYIIIGTEKRIRNLGLIFSGLAVIEICEVINNVIKLGELGHGGYIGLLNFQYNVIWEILFTPVTGYLVASPIFVIAIFLYLRLLRKDRKEFLLLGCLGITPFIKLLGESWSFSAGTDFGARGYLSEMIIVVLLLSYGIRSVKYKKLLSIFMLISAMWTGLYLSAVVVVGERLVTYSTFFDLLRPYLREFFYVLLFDLSENTRRAGVSLHLLRISLFLLFCLLFFFLLRRFRSNQAKLFYWMIPGIAVSLYVVTSLNIMNNSRNARATLLKSGTVITDGKHALYYSENMSCIQERKMRCFHRRDQKCFNEMRHLEKNYKQKVSEETLYTIP